ncbi:MAG: hypothetical protein ACLQVY_13305 [Limisphaerales bacterium]
MNLNALKKREERKREAAYDPAARWQHIQQTINWAEANLPPHLRRNRPRTAKMRSKPAGNTPFPPACIPPTTPVVPHEPQSVQEL